MALGVAPPNDPPVAARCCAGGAPADPPAAVARGVAPPDDPPAAARCCACVGMPGGDPTIVEFAAFHAAKAVDGDTIRSAGAGVQSAAAAA